LRVSEARDLGDFDRFKLCDHLKSYTAAPPDVLRIDEKHIREYSIANCCAVIITSNHKTDGIYLPADDRRHYIAWSERTKEDPEFQGDYWPTLWDWYLLQGGFKHVAAWLRARDLSKFNPKAPPPKTEAFWAIVNANRAPEEAEFAHILEVLNQPNTVILKDLQDIADTDVGSDFHEWLKDRRNRRTIPHRLQECGYVPVRNAGEKRNGLWKINGRYQAVYAKAELSLRDQIWEATARTDKKQ